MTLAAFHQRFRNWIPLVFFAGGFCFDALMLRRIDEPFALVQQAVYLAAAGVLICLNLVKYAPKSPFGAKVWHYHTELMHFLLGTLLNAYTIFFFKASSIFTSIVFVACLCGLLYINESKRIRESTSAVRFTLFSLCLTSYLVCLVPILLDSIGTGPFLLAVLGSTAAAFPMFYFLRKRKLEKELWMPFAAVQLVFVLLYFTGLIPPVPLALNYMGLYHGIEKKDGEYLLSSTRSRWRFWQNGDQSFAARPGDKIYFFVRVFSPAKFNEQLNVRWLHEGPQGWIAWDAIPLKITGGREEGFRGHTIKANYEPGDWRVQVETHDGRELGRLYFTVTADTSTEPRDVHIDVQ